MFNFFKQDGNKEYYTKMLCSRVMHDSTLISEIEELVNNGADVNAEVDNCGLIYGGKRSVIINAIITNLINHGKHNQIVKYLMIKGAIIDTKKLNIALDLIRHAGYTIEVDEFRKNMKG